MRVFVIAMLSMTCTVLVAEDAPKTGTREQAAALTADGLKAMQDSNNTPERIIDAALDFTKVVAIDQALGDTDGVCEMEANIYWCKKRMDLTMIKTYLAKKNGEAKATVDLTHVDAVLDKPVAVDEAKVYFDRAEQYATEHPDHTLQIAMRYFEVADRFQGTPFSLKAQHLSLEAEQKYMETLKSLPSSDTLFSAPHTSKLVPGQRRAIPATESLRAPILTIKTTYKDEFAATRPKHMLALVTKLMDQSTSTDDDIMKYALMSEARDQAIKAGDALAVLGIIDQIDANFQLTELIAVKKQALSRIQHVSAIHAMEVLLENPKDGDSNTVVGKYLAFELQRWPVALPFLKLGSDAHLKTLAEMEDAHPVEPAHQAEIGDGWYDIGKKAPESSRDGVLARAYFWYKQAVDNLKGVNKDVTKRRMTEIAGIVLVDGITDWDKLTPVQWERLKSAVVQVSMMSPPTAVPAEGVPLPPYRILPNPTDTWHVVGPDIDDPVTFHGDDTRMVGTFHAGEMIMALGGNSPTSLAVVTEGKDALTLTAAVSPPAPGRRGGRRGGGEPPGGGAGGAVYNGGPGVIRVKFRSIDE